MSETVETIIDYILSFSDLSDGWDGEDARKPSQKAIDSAVDFLRMLENVKEDFDSSIHSNGDVILYSPDGIIFRFDGEGVITIS